MYVSSNGVARSRSNLCHEKATVRSVSIVALHEWYYPKIRGI